MKLYTRFAVKILLSLALLLALGENQVFSQNVKRLGKEQEALVGKNNSGKEIAENLKKAKEAELKNLITGMGLAANTVKGFANIEKAFDELMAEKDLKSTMLASSLLQETVNHIPKSSYGLAKELGSFPNGICERAATLLEYPNPIVQAQAEWVIALRVKKQDSSNPAVKKHYMRGVETAPWYGKWKARGPAAMLRDDYARQLLQENAHWNIELVTKAVENVATRTTAVAGDAGSKPNEEAKAKFQAMLVKAREVIASGNLTNSHEAYLRVRLAARDLIIATRADFPSEGFVFFTDPTLTGGVWNVNVPVTNGTNFPAGGDIFIKRGVDPVLKPVPLLGAKLGDGSIRGIDVTWESDKILFSFWHQPINNAPPYGWDVTKNAHLYEMNLTGGPIQQLTSSPGSNDIEPCFLPDGGYVFSSDRSSFGNQCAGPILQNKRCTTLFRLDSRRSDQPVAISNNKDFDRHSHVLNDGTISFLHWEYQERGLYNTHSVWRCRPDGTNMDAYFKQHISVPMSIRDVQQVPGSDLHVATAQGHHDGVNGPIVLFNPSLGINNEKAMWLVTPGVSEIEGGLGPLEKQVVAEGGVKNSGGSYVNPFPMSEKAFLTGHDMTGNESEFGIYYVDVWGNKELLHRDKDMSCFMPHALRKRERPPVVADTIKPDQTFATAFLEDVYRDLPGVQKGAVKYLRMSQSLMLPAPLYQVDGVWEYNHLHYLPGDATARHFGHWAWSPSRTIGLINVEADGSAFFKVPAGTPVYLQALDENYCEVRRMRTSFTLQRGEFRSCTGCHESRLETAGNRKPLPKETLGKGPQMPEAPSWGENVVLDFREHIQPILDQSCVSCHGQQNPAGGIELTAREIGGFSQSYRSLFGIKPNDPTPVKELDWHFVLNPKAEKDSYINDKEATKIHIQMQENTWPGQMISISDRMDDARITQPLQFGSNKSRLILTLLEENEFHHGLKDKMGKENWLKLVTWVDHNANYHGTLFDVSKFNKTKKFTRVPYDIPSAWIPADLNPSFQNKGDNSHLPPITSVP